MTTWLVTRHPGAREWLAARGIAADRAAAHLDVADLVPGDSVIGVLPYHLAAAVCAGGGRFFSLDVEVPAELRGVELSAAQLEALGARLVEYRVMARPDATADGAADNQGISSEI